MRRGFAIIYPRTYSEVDKVFKILDDRWNEMVLEENKKLKNQKWHNIFYDINFINTSAKKYVDDMNKESSQLNLISLVKKATNFINNNFHSKILDLSTKWMKERRIPQR
jgi:hypothetical protein